MDQAGTRSLTSQLAEDLAWLEQHARKPPEQGAKAGELRLAAALVRNVLNPFLERESSAPLHVAVVGGERHVEVDDLEDRVGHGPTVSPGGRTRHGARRPGS